MPRFGLALSACLLIGPSAFACSVPVFRYALERWQPSRYELIVFHRGPLSMTDRRTVARLETAGRRANVRVTDADLASGLDPSLQKVWDRNGNDAPLPRLVLRYPESGPQVPSAWAGPLSTGPDLLFDSPARRAVFDGLTAGNAGVVVLLLSGNAATDEAARTFLRRELPPIARGIALPAPTEDGPQVESALPLRIAFPVVEVGRTPAEDTLVRILLNSEEGLGDVKGPIAFPVFGRGRALCSLHDKDLANPDELRRSLEFLCRACSCQVKELNPGVDLLIAANWDVVHDAERGPPARVVTTTVPSRAETRPTSGSEATAAELRSPPPAGYSAADLEPAPRQPTGRSPLLRLGTVGAGLLVLLTGVWAFRTRRSPPPAGH